MAIAMIIIMLAGTQRMNFTRGLVGERHDAEEPPLDVVGGVKNGGLEDCDRTQKDVRYDRREE